MLALLLVGCGDKGHSFTLSADGYTLTDEKAGIAYTILPPAFEPASGGREVGVYRTKLGEDLPLREIPLQDARVFLADDKQNVFCAAAVPDVSQMAIKQVLICEEEEISVQIGAVRDAAAVARVQALYFHAPDAELPLTRPLKVRRFKLVADELPNVYFCFNYYRYEDGSAYFYEHYTGRTVAIPAADDLLFGVS